MDLVCFFHMQQFKEFVVPNILQCVFSTVWFLWLFFRHANGSKELKPATLMTLNPKELQQCNTDFLTPNACRASMMSLRLISRILFLIRSLCLRVSSSWFSFISSKWASKSIIMTFGMTTRASLHYQKTLEIQRGPFGHEGEGRLESRWKLRRGAQNPNQF